MAFKSLVSLDLSEYRMVTMFQYFSGKRRMSIVDVPYLLKQLQKHRNSTFGCSSGDLEVIHEKKNGLETLWTFKCKICMVEEDIASEQPSQESTNILVANATLASGKLLFTHQCISYAVLAVLLKNTIKVLFSWYCNMLNAPIPVTLRIYYAQVTFIKIGWRKKRRKRIPLTL